MFRGVTYSIIYLIVIQDVCCKVVFNRRSENCQLVVMCPQFCLKVKDGCYVCQCGSTMKNYMGGAISKMKHDYDPLYQTGSQFANIQMGGPAGTWSSAANGMSPWGGKSGQAMGQYNTMMSSNTNTEQTAHYLEPDFREFYRPFYGVMPGRCPTIDYTCPLQCWTTEISTGCLQCKCTENTDHSITTVLPTVLIKETTQMNSGSQESITPKESDFSTGDTSTTSMMTTTEALTSSDKIYQSTNNLIPTESTLYKPTQTETKSVTPTASSVIRETQFTESSLSTETTESFLSNSTTTVFTSPTIIQTSAINTDTTDTDPESTKPSSKEKIEISNQSLDGTSIKPTLSGEDVVQRLLNGIRYHDSLDSIVEKLMSDLHIDRSDFNITKEPTPTTTVVPGCTDISDTCRPDCQIKDPLTSCAVCVCSEEPITTTTSHIDCQPFDETCPTHCITLKDTMCPECSCDTDTTTIATETQETPQHNTTVSTDDTFTICSPVRRDCPRDCITFDDRFCAVCQCGRSGKSRMRADITTTTDSSHVCRPIDCTYSCLDFDEYYCPICTCSKYPDGSNLIG